METSKSAKHALVLSVLSLMLSVVLLAGTTFAWFTDSVTNSNNRIEAGTLQVNLLNKGEVVSEDDPIFNYDKWEPGCSTGAELSVQNAGTLAVKWRLELQNAEATLGIENAINVTINGEAKGTLADFMNGEALAEGTLEAGTTSAVYAIVLEMSEEAGDTYQGAVATFDILLRATQNTADATYPVTPNEFAQQLATLEAGDTLTLGTGVFDLGSNTVELADGVSIVGAGADKTVICGSLKYQNNATIKGVTLQADPSNSLLGLVSRNQAVFDNGVITVEDCVFSGYKYGVQLASDVTNTKLVVRNTTFDNVWCAISVKDKLADGTSTGITYEVTDCNFTNVVYQLQTFYPSVYYTEIGGTSVDDAVANGNAGNWMQAVQPGEDAVENGAKLQAAINSAMDGGTVVLPAGEYVIPLLSNLGDKEVVIQGEEGAEFVGRGDEGFITVRGSENAKLTVRGMTFKGETANDTTGTRGVCFSGQANTNATLVVEDCTFENLTTGVFLGGVANATVTNCTFRNCFAGIGGSEDVTGTLKVENCVFEGNTETIGWAGTGTLVITGSPTCESFNQYNGADATQVSVSGGEYNSQS